MKKYPIVLNAATGSINFISREIALDLRVLNEHHKLLPEHIIENLNEDLHVLISNEITNEIQIQFYDPMDPSAVYFEKGYRVKTGAFSSDKNKRPGKQDVPTSFEFDIFISFSRRFERLKVVEQKRTLESLKLKWFDWSKYFDNNTEFQDHNKSKPLELNTTEHYSENNERGILDAYNNILVGTGTSTGPTKGVGLSGINEDARIQEGEYLVRSNGALPSSIMKPFFSGKSLFISAYTDSRKLIEEFVNAAKSLNLLPVLWTFSEGLNVVSDLTFDQDLYGDFCSSNHKLSPFDTIRKITKEAKSNTIYLLEDFHYYLTRDNVGRQEFAELISLIKSMPEVLRKKNSFVVILAPSLDLPPEIAPIFEIIKDNQDKKDFHYLKRFGIDLTKLVLENKIKPVIGRDAEIFECLKVLSRMEENNPLLVGNAGVGKTAIVEGLATKIVNGNVPTAIVQKRIFSLNLNAMISGTKYRGEFEKRLEGLLDEVRSNSDKIIIFIDEIHALLGMGGTEGSTGAENILKPSLARGEFPCIGATTMEEYKKYIAPDRALARRFQFIEIKEPEIEQTTKILIGVKATYENHHHVKITDSALFECVKLSDKFFVNQYFPGKAIKMLDSVCAAASLAGKNQVTPALVADEFNKLS